MNKRKIFWNFFFILIIFLIDRISKIAMINTADKIGDTSISLTSFLNLNLIWNDGIAFGLECISRGANSVTFFENYDKAIKVLKTNINNMDVTNNTKIIEKNCFDYFETLANFEFRYDLIFLDPPYKEKKINFLIDNIYKKKILQKNGVLIIHRHKKDDIKISDTLKILDNRNYGISKIVFGKYS